MIATAWALTKKTIAEWQKDKAASLAAALAFYTVLSLAPLLVVAVSLAGIFFGEQAARGELTRQFDALVGPSGSQAAQTILASAKEKSSGVIGAMYTTWERKYADLERFAEFAAEFK